LGTLPAECMIMVMPRVAGGRGAGEGPPSPWV